MALEIHPFTTKEAWLSMRANDLTSTEVAVLFGKSPYQTLPELWDAKRSGEITILEENERMFWGTQLQDAIAHGAAIRNGWEIRLMSEYARLPEERLGASFDYEVSLRDGTKGILEIKNVDYLQFKKEWVDDDQGLQAPVHIEFQLQHQMMLTGAQTAYICALVAGNSLVTIARSADPEVQGAIRYKAAEFWKSVDAGEAPPLDFVRDADFILSKYREVVPKKTVDVRGVMGIREAALAYTDLGEQVKALNVQRDGAKAQIVSLMGDAELALGADFKVTSKATKSGRSALVTWKSEEQQ